MTTMTEVPERNRAIKKLLEDTYGRGTVRVKAGNGTARHWVYIHFQTVPESLRGLNYRELYDTLETLIRGAGIEFSSYPADDMGGDKTNACIEITRPGEAY